MSMFGDSPKQRIFEVLEDLKDQGYKREDIALMCVECLRAWIEWEMSASDEPRRSP